MKKINILIILIILSIFNTQCFSFTGEKDFISDLLKGKQSVINNTGALGYTKNEETILELAYTKVFKNENVPICEIMKISIDLKYNPYNVIKLIYSNNKKIPLDQLCMCAVETGINKSIITKAAIDSKSYSIDEITQAQCLTSEIGFAYTPNDSPPPLIPKISPPTFISPSSPTL